MTNTTDANGRILSVGDRVTHDTPLDMHKPGGRVVGILPTIVDDDAIDAEVTVKWDNRAELLVHWNLELHLAD